MPCPPKSLNEVRALRTATVQNCIPRINFVLLSAIILTLTFITGCSYLHIATDHSIIALNEKSKQIIWTKNTSPANYNQSMIIGVLMSQKLFLHLNKLKGVQ